MRTFLLLWTMLVAALFPGHSRAMASNSTAPFSEVWSLDLANALPKELESAAFAATGNVGSIPCAQGVAYFSEGGNMHGGWSAASFVCHRNRAKNSALWVIYIPQYTDQGRDFGEGRVVGVDCTLAGGGWRCRKRSKMISPIGPTLRMDRRKQDDDAVNYIRVL